MLATLIFLENLAPIRWRVASFWFSNQSYPPSFPLDGIYFAVYRINWGLWGFKPESTSSKIRMATISSFGIFSTYCGFIASITWGRLEIHSFGMKLFRDFWPSLGVIEIKLSFSLGIAFIKYRKKINNQEGKLGKRSRKSVFWALFPVDLYIFNLCMHIRAFLWAMPFW